MPWRYAEPPYTSMPSYRMTGIRFAIGGIGAGAGRQRRRPLHRSISRHSGHPFTSPSTTPPPSAATRPECAAQPSFLRSAITGLAVVPPLRACRDKSDPTRTTVLRKTHGRSIPRPPQPTSDRQPPPAPTRPPSCRLSAPPIRQKSHPRPVKRDFRGTEHMPPPTSNRETRRYIYNRALKTHRAKFTKNGPYLRVLRAWFP